MGHYRADLLEAADEFADDLRRDQAPLDLQPLTRVARQVLRGAAGERVPAGDPAAAVARRIEAEAGVHLARRLAGPRAGFALRVLDEMGRAPLDPFAEDGLAGQALPVC